MRQSHILSLSSIYHDFLNSCEDKLVVGEHPPDSNDTLCHELELQFMWLNGEFGTQFQDNLGRYVQIIHPGRWNKSAGPDFLGATLQFDGDVIKGDIELDPQAEDWEHHGHGANPLYNQVVLHLIARPHSKQWYTRNQEHQHVPHVFLPNVDKNPSIHAKTTSLLNPCPHHETFLQLSDAQLSQIIETAAAYRFHHKHEQWQHQVNHLGFSQALYENLAIALGYKNNQFPMQHLARRLPIAETPRADIESLLFGTAGFLQAILPTESTQEAIDYHKNLWQVWWKSQDRYSIDESRQPSWNLSGLRPANYPQRRVAALAQVTQKWTEFETICQNIDIKKAQRFLTGLRHPYWDFHFTLPSKKLAKNTALIGASRANEFIINHLLPMSLQDQMWSHYKEFKSTSINSKVLSMASTLLQTEERIKKFTRYVYQQQGLLQLFKDFCQSSQPCPCQFNCRSFD